MSRRVEERVEMSRVIMVVVLALALALGVAACGDDSDEGEGNGSGAAAGAPEACESEDLAFGANEPSSSFFAYFTAVGRVVNENSDCVELTIIQSPGGVDNMKGLNQGSMDVAQVDASVILDAYNGTGTFEGQADDSLRYLWVYGLFPQDITVTEESGVQSLQDLHGKPYSAGEVGTSTEALTKELFALLGIEPKWFDGSWDDIVAAMKDGRIVGYTKGTPGFAADPTQLDVDSTDPVKVIGFSPEDQEKIKAEMPNISFLEVPENAMESLTGAHDAFTTFALILGVTTKDGLSETSAYEIVKAVVENQAEQAAAFEGVEGVDFTQTTLDSAPIPLHAGAVKYFEEAGETVPAELKSTR
jgi:uncharacterized protein